MRCTSCDREIVGTPAIGAPCPSCGVPLLAAATDVPLEVDPAWAAERAAKQAAAAAPAPKRPRAGGLLLGLVMIVMIGVIFVMVLQRQPTAKGTALPPGIEITITAPAPAAVQIDGARAGTTPMSIRIPPSTRTMTIDGNGVRRQIRADHSQTVNLVKP